MGMAASQARYLQLTARKTNTEYEGQQLNQERVVLANRTADLFNQMLMTEVPTCPDSNDFTRLQYSWTDGYNDAVISDYYQLSVPDEEYNYVVTSYHYEDVYTGTRKQMNDPKIQATRNLEYDYDEISYNENINFLVNTLLYDPDKNIYTILNERRIPRVLEEADDAGDIRLQLDSIYGRTRKARSRDFEYDDTTGNYIYKTQDEEGEPLDITYVPVNTRDEESDLVKLCKQTYRTEYDPTKKYYYDAEYGTFFEDIGIEDLKKNQGFAPEIVIRNQYDGTVYYTDGEHYTTLDDILNIDVETNPNLVLKKAIEDMHFSNFTYVGNCKLNPISEKEFYENEDIQTEIQQILDDMSSEDKGHRVSYANLSECFDPVTGEYIGGLYSFKHNGVVYYTTHQDLETSAHSAFINDNQEVLADNNIDPQTIKLPYYKAVYLNTKIEDTQRALLETDGKGRFKSVRFEDDSTVYTLNTETITDEDAYRDAMNQYYYKQEKYDKAIRDINAKTELIQAQDRTLELRMKQLDTEQNALQIEMEAVKKVISKNVEGSFKTFGGG